MSRCNNLSEAQLNARLKEKPILPAAKNNVQSFRAAGITGKWSKKRK